MRTTVNLDAQLVEELMRRHPGWTRTAVIEEGLRALLARDASIRLAALGGAAPHAGRPKRRPRGMR
ncbi:MAG: type II toxin-antitoxin system VapB family antitoxin [Deltaproteobacteria bacterium]|nr:type II toxin-antitoxin system VapB family antitoxin [Deltaproteobacteria bacterium]